MKYRKLRIAWSMAWGIVAVLLVALWVRSYWSGDFLIYYRSTGALGLGYRRGMVTCEHNFRVAGSDWTLLHIPVEGENDDRFSSRAVLGWEDGRPAYVGALVRFWFLVLLCAAVSVLPWMRWRFSLRTLLIATTLFAIGLGLIVWAAK